MKHSLSPFDALPQSKPVGQQQTDCGYWTTLDSMAPDAKLLDDGTNMVVL